MMKHHHLAVLATLLAGSPASAGEGSIRLADDPATATVVARCSNCHSLDYIRMNAAFLKRDGWEAEVRKMA